MGRKHTRKIMKGGFLENLSTTLSGWGSSLSQGTSSMWEKTKNAASQLTSMTTPPSDPSPAPASVSTPAPMSSSTYGGRHSRRRRHMRGGFKDNTPTTGIAVHAASISDVKTAQPHNLVGGKTKRRHKSKSRKGKTRRN